MAEKLHELVNFWQKGILHKIAWYHRGGRHVHVVQILARVLAKQIFTFLLQLPIIFLLWMSQILHLNAWLFLCLEMTKHLADHFCLPGITHVHTFSLHLPIILWLCTHFTDCILIVHFSYVSWPTFICITPERWGGG